MVYTDVCGMRCMCSFTVGDILDLNFNACLTLLIIGFVFALIFGRVLMAVVNRGFLLVDYAKAELYPGGKMGAPTGLGGIIGGLFEMAKPMIQAKMQEWAGVKPK